MSEHTNIEGGGNKRVAVFIAVLAALLALAEMGGKSAQTHALGANIEASNLWAFFQAKTIRMTAVRAAAEALETIGAEGLPAERVDAVAKRVQAWRATADRYDNEPETGEGRQQLSARAKISEIIRDRALAAYHQFEFASASFQIAIVLASASVITGAIWLMFVAGGLGAIGLAFAGLGFFAPTLIDIL